MMAAGRAAEVGAKVIVLERGLVLGKKLRISGKGRANVTNTADLPEFIAAFGPNGKFLYSTFSHFFSSDLRTFLDNLGVPTKVERGRRVFPESDRADDVAVALERWLSKNGVQIRRGERVKSVLVDGGRAAGVVTGRGSVTGDAVIIATGGATYPETGATGDGYTMARELGHHVTPLRPSLSAMVIKEQWAKDLQGLSLRNVSARLYLVTGGKGKKIAEEFGEMLFTHFGVSGPMILTLSRHVPELQGKGRIELSVDLKPALSEEQLDNRLQRDFVQKKQFKNYLPDLVPRALIPVLLMITAIPNDLPVHRITAEQRRRIIGVLKELTVTVTRLRPMEEAIVTAGGVDIREIDPRTMESKLVSGLYFAGEVIDIDAVTGGYNLQAAFSTGWVAGESAATAELEECKE